MTQQLCIFSQKSEDLLDQRMQTIEEKFEKTRKSLYARNNELMKLYQEQKHRADVLESALCKCGLKIDITNTPITLFSIEKNK